MSRRRITSMIVHKKNPTLTVILTLTTANCREELGLTKHYNQPRNRNSYIYCERNSDHQVSGFFQCQKLKRENAKLSFSAQQNARKSHIPKRLNFAHKQMVNVDIGTNMIKPLMSYVIYNMYIEEYLEM